MNKRWGVERSCRKNSPRMKRGTRVKMDGTKETMRVIFFLFSHTHTIRAMLPTLADWLLRQPTDGVLFNISFHFRFIFFIIININTTYGSIVVLTLGAEWCDGHPLGDTD